MSLCILDFIVEHYKQKEQNMDGKSDELVTEMAAATASNEVGNSNETQLGKGKRTVKLTHKAFVEKLETLQNVRKEKLHKVKNIRKATEEYMHKNSVA